MGSRDRSDARQKAAGEWRTSAVAASALQMVPGQQRKVQRPSAEQTGVTRRLLPNEPKWGVAMRYRNEIVPVAIMCSLSVAIMMVFAVTVMH
jgi:hypothetical protein